MGAIISFLGGAAFRLIWGSITDFLNKRQEHKQELDSLRLQGNLDAEKHEREIERLKVAAELGIKELQVKSEGALEEIDAKGFADASTKAIMTIGIKWVDAWNGIVRPAAATIALILWVLSLVESKFIMTNWDMEMVGVILGFYFATRVISQKR